MELALLVAIMELALARDRVPGTAARQPRCAGLMRDVADAAGDHGRIELRDKRHARLGDGGLLAGNVVEAGAEELLMIERKIGDAGDQRTVDNIGRIKASAKTNFENAGVGRRAGKSEDRRGGRDLEEARLDAGPGVEDFGEQVGEDLVVDQAPGDADALIEADEVRACEGMDAMAARLERRTEEGDGRAFAV